MLHILRTQPYGMSSPGHRAAPRPSSPPRSQATAAQSSQILAQTPSSPGSLKSQIQLQPTFDESNDATALEEEEEEDDDDDNGQTSLTKIDVEGPSWDDSDEEDGLEADDEAGLTAQQRQRRRARRVDPSYLHSLRPSPSRLRRWFGRLTKSPAALASLSAPHVSANLFSASINPAVLLSMPAYFNRTGILIGIIGLVVVATLAGAGGGLWVVLGRYVGGNTIEAITAASCGRNTRWKGNLGRSFSGILLAFYATGTAVIAYFALADLLLQVLFHYSPRGIPLHDRLFVTVVVGGIITAPLIIFPLAKRNLIRLSTFCAVLFYPCILAILLSVIYQSPPTTSPKAPIKMPSLNPLYPPSIWAPFSLLPLLSLSASPLQVIAHNRSLRRTGISGSNVKAFMAAQGAQTVAAVGVAIAFGIGVGTEGMSARLGVDIHPNLFTTLPLSDSLNVARTLFIFILATHLALCLVTARSSWARLLKLLNLNPLRKRVTMPAAAAHADAQGSDVGALPSDSAQDASAAESLTSSSTPAKKAPRRWGRRARDALAGLLLWALTASTAYWSGVGGFHHKKGDKSSMEDEVVEANFTRAQEVLGLVGAGVGFVLPALVWIILFHIRQPRAILPPFAADMARQASAWFLGPQSVLARQRRNRDQDAERQPLIDDDELQQDESSRAFRASLENHTSQGRGPTGASSMPYGRHETDGADREADEATRILLARKERALQKRSRGRRLYQDIIVLAGILPLGVSLIVLGALDLKHGGW